MIIVFIRGLHYDAIKLIVFEPTDILTSLDVRVYLMTLIMNRSRISTFHLRQLRVIHQHKVFKIITSNRESYALDIAGAQFGLHAVIIPWNRYLDLHVREVQSSEDIAIV